jgi:hypothetical protein
MLIRPRTSTITTAAMATAISIFRKISISGALSGLRSEDAIEQ